MSNWLYTSNGVEYRITLLYPRRSFSSEGTIDHVKDIWVATTTKV